MMRKIRLVLFLFLIGLGAAAWGCGGDNGDPNDGIAPRITPPLRDDVDQEAQALLVQMPLTPEDVGPGLVQIGATVSSNEDVAGEGEGAEELLAELEESGRRLGLNVTFQPREGSERAVRIVQNTVVLYWESEDASAAMSDAVDAASELDWRELYPDLDDFLLQDIDRDIGDERTWFRASGRDDEHRIQVDDQLTFRVGEVWGFLRVVSIHPADTERDALLGEVEEWGRAVAGRVSSALAGAPVDGE
jgi:hypothetical protein